MVHSVTFPVARGTLNFQTFNQTTDNWKVHL